MEERLNSRDILQTAVGSFAGALTFAFEDMPRLGDSMPLANLGLIVLASIAAASVISYHLGVRKLGPAERRMLFYSIPLRTVLHYVSAVLFSAVVLYLLGVNTLATPPGDVLKRVILLALPATVFGSAADLIDSQKND